MLWQIDNFLTDAECEFIKQAGVPLLHRSTAGLSRQVDKVRTSSTAWLVWCARLVTDWAL